MMSSNSTRAVLNLGMVLSMAAFLGACGSMSLPLELSLKTFPGDGVRLAFQPTRELKSLRRSENSRRAAVRTTTPIRRTRRIQSSEPIHKRNTLVERGNTGFEATHSCSRIQRAARHLREFVVSRSSALNDGVVDWRGPRHDTEAP